MGAEARDHEDDLARIEEYVGRITGNARGEIMTALGDNRQGVLVLAERIGRNANLSNPAGAAIVAIRNGEHRRRLRAMNSEEGTGPAPVPRVPAEEALRRLYDAKTEQLRQYGVPEPDRIMIAVDYACSEIWRCSIGPMPPGGIGQLEDELYRAIGCDRFTGLRFPAADTRA